MTALVKGRHYKLLSKCPHCKNGHEFKVLEINCDTQSATIDMYGHCWWKPQKLTELFNHLHTPLIHLFPCEEIKPHRLNFKNFTHIKNYRE